MNRTTVSWNALPRGRLTQSLLVIVAFLGSANIARFGFLAFGNISARIWHGKRSRDTRPLEQDLRLSPFQSRLDALSPAVLKGIRRGIEKESLRVNPDGTLART